MGIKSIFDAYDYNKGSSENSLTGNVPFDDKINHVAIVPELNFIGSIHEQLRG